MNKRELIAQMAKRTGYTQSEAQELLEAFQETVTETLKGGEEVHIPHFGKFYVREREEHKVPVFHAGKGLRESI